VVKRSEIPQRKMPYRRWAVVVLVFSGIAIIVFGCYVGQMFAEYSSFSDALPVFVGGLLLIAILFWSPMNKFIKTSKITEARVTQRFKEEHSEISAGEYGNATVTRLSYWLAFQFDTEDREVTLRAQVSKHLFDKKLKGSSLQIRYSPQDPDIVQIEGGFFYWQ
jgi:hypothetical protein